MGDLVVWRFFFALKTHFREEIAGRWPKEIDSPTGEGEGKGYNPRGLDEDVRIRFLLTDRELPADKNIQTWIEQQRFFC